MSGSVEAGRHPVLLAEEEVGVHEVPGEDRPAVCSAEELLFLVEDEVVVHEVLAELEHELEELLAVAPLRLPVQFSSPPEHKEGIRQGAANEQGQSREGEAREGGGEG